MMNKEQQIEAMAKIICTITSRNKGECEKCSLYQGKICSSFEAAEKLYNSKHGEQGEWIKYPHGSGIYCSLCKHKRRYRDIHDAFCPNCGAEMNREMKAAIKGE